VRFEDRDLPETRLTVAAAEADYLAGRGKAVTPRGKPARLWAWIKKHPWRIFVFIVGAWFASVAIPALVQQWADRRAELEFKNTLITTMTDLIADTTSGVSILNGHETPEGAARESAARRVIQAQGEAERAKARTALAAAEVAEDKAERTLYNQTKVLFIKNGAAVEARLLTYFKPSLAVGWATYSDAVQVFLELAKPGGRTPEYQKDAQLRTYGYLCEGEDKLGPKEAGDTMRAACARFAMKRPLLLDGFPSGVIGRELLRRRQRILGGVQTANADGYSVGPRDYACAVLLPGC
jgi:hypothetical protein